MIVNLIMITCSVSLAIFAILYMLTHRENYGTQTIVVLTSLIFLFYGVLYFPCLTLSVEIIYAEDVALSMWKNSMIFRIVTFGLTTSLCNFILLYSHLKFYFSFLYCFLSGFIISLLSLPGSIAINPVGNYYNYVFLNPVLLILIFIFDFFIIGVLFFVILKNLSAIRNPLQGRMLFMMIIFFSMVFLTDLIYIATQNILMKDISYFLGIIGSLSMSYTILKMPEFFVVLNNKIYDFIIFQKSGILLYSYNFETGKETDETLLKGSILIGINHILANFTYKKDQLNLIKMKDRDLVFEYDTYYGYALLLITDQKNVIIEKAVKQFMQKFNDLNKEGLKKLDNFGQLIDVSVFKNAKDLIQKYFYPYLKKNKENSS